MPLLSHAQAQQLQAPGMWWDYAPMPAAAATGPDEELGSVGQCCTPVPAAAADELSASQLRRALHDVCVTSFSLLASGLVQAHGLRRADYAPLLGLVRR